MGFDIAEWTVRVLTDGLPPLPTELEKGQTFPAAVWRRNGVGAVLFLRRWRNNNIDSDCAITRRAANGEWEEPSGWGGGGWIDDPLTRPQDGWDGSPLLWIGSSGTELALDSTGRTTIVEVTEGVAATSVSGIEVHQGGSVITESIDSPCGAFIVGVLDQPATLVPVDSEGSRVVGPDGKDLAKEIAPGGGPGTDSSWVVTTAGNLFGEQQIARRSGQK